MQRGEGGSGKFASSERKSFEMVTKKFDLEKVGMAIDVVSDEDLPVLRRALAEANVGLGRVTSPEMIVAQQDPTKSAEEFFLQCIGKSERGDLAEVLSKVKSREPLVGDELSK